MSHQTLRKFKTLYESPWVVRLATLLITVFMTLILTMFLPLSITFLKANDRSMVIIIVSIGFILSLFGMFYLYRFWKLINPDMTIQKRHESLFTIRKIGLFIILFLLYIGFQLLVSFLTADKTISKPSYDITWVTIVIIWWFNGIVAPIMEELSMKGVFLSLFFRQPRLYNYISPNISPRLVQMTAGVIASALITTMLHGDANSFTMLGFLLNGVITAILYYRSSHVFYPIVFHMINNHLVIIGLILYHLGLLHV